MCTAISWQGCFGRTLDLEYSYTETVTIAPRCFPFAHPQMPPLPMPHLAMIGMAFVQKGYPLYYDACNEKGLAMAGLHFPDHAFYPLPQADAENIPPFALIPWLLAQCATVDEAELRLKHLHLAALPFSDELPLSPLHWLLSDNKRSLTIEAVADGLRLYENPVGVLTNNPPFPLQQHHLAQFMQLSSAPPENRFAPGLALRADSRGMGAIGLPGDFSSASRFVRAAFVRGNALPAEGTQKISQFFHILGAVEQQAGCVRLANGKYEKTIYTSCALPAEGLYCYTTYENRRITAVRLDAENAAGNRLISYPLRREEEIRFEN